MATIQILVTLVSQPHPKAYSDTMVPQRHHINGDNNDIMI